jgi:2,3-bisphosphoglycerate-dependent phosphoglycerate mutase
MILYCVRHGESTYNSLGRIQGQLDVPLSERGVQQSQAAAAALGQYPIGAIFASPLQRAFQTAQIVAEALGLEIHTDPRLMEINTGIFQGKTPEELAESCPEALARWRSGDPNYAIPGGESRAQLAARTGLAFGAIRQSGYEHVLLVAHGGVIVTAIKSLLQTPLSGPPLAVENGSITRLAWNGDGTVEMLALNEIDHLRGVAMGGIGDLPV